MGDDIERRSPLRLRRAIARGVSGVRRKPAQSLSLPLLRACRETTFSLSLTSGLRTKKKAPATQRMVAAAFSLCQARHRPIFFYFFLLDSGSHKHKRTRNRAWVRKKKKEILWRCNFSFSSGCSLERWAAGHWALLYLYGAQCKRKSLSSQRWRPSINIFNLMWAPISVSGQSFSFSRFAGYHHQWMEMRQRLWPVAHSWWWRKRRM